MRRGTLLTREGSVAAVCARGVDTGEERSTGRGSDCTPTLFVTRFMEVVAQKMAGLSQVAAINR